MGEPSRELISLEFQHTVQLYIPLLKVSKTQ